MDTVNEEEVKQKQAEIAPIFRSELRGLRLTEGTDAILQCSVIGVPTPKVCFFLIYF